MRSKTAALIVTASAAILAPPALCSAQTTEPQLELTWYVTSSAFNDLAVASDGTVLVVEGAIVRRFDECGTALDTWTIGSLGRHIACDTEGRVYVTDGVASCARVYSGTGEHLYDVGSIGSGDGQCLTPSDLAVAPDGSIYVADQTNHRVVAFANDGAFLTTWGAFGQASGEFNTPLGIAASDDGEIFVADLYLTGDFYRARIQCFSAEGIFRRSWLSIDSYMQATPEALAVDAEGNVYLTVGLAQHPDQALKFDRHGGCLAAWRGAATPPMVFYYGTGGIAVDAHGGIYIGSNGSVWKFVQPFVLGCPPGDVDGDCDTDLADYLAMTLSMTGPQNPAVVVGAGCLAAAPASVGSYFSNGNDLTGYATQDGYDAADWTIAWTVESKPAGSGAVAIFDPGQLDSAFVITAPALAGDYVFRLTVSNPTTSTQATDTTTLTLTP